MWMPASPHPEPLPSQPSITCAIDWLTEGKSRNWKYETRLNRNRDQRD
jgi:hypothetical protein